MKHIESLKKYADVIVQTGLNVQPGDIVNIVGEVEAIELMRLVNEKAYERGAKKVLVDIHDSKIFVDKMKYETAESLSEVPEFHKLRNQYLEDEKVSMLYIKSDSPELLKDIDADKVMKRQIALSEASKSLGLSRMRYNQNWLIIGYPSEDWAKLVFPELEASEAVEQLLDAILKTVRVDHEDPVASWTEHAKFLKDRAKWLSDYNFEKLVYTAPGTNLEIGLIDGSQWAGGGHVNKDGFDIQVNMPTEEVFNSPNYREVNGTVSNTLPLSVNGQIVDNFSLTFKDGVVVEYKAEKGYETLKNLLETDEGAKRLGEVALVPVDSPISNSGILFYNTLFDENASCHIAIGKAYPGPVPGASEMNEEQVDAVGLNQSLIHVDFMIGSKDLNIDGVTRDGQVIPVFRNGNWA